MGVNCSKTCSSEEEDKETLIRRVRRSCGHLAVKKGIKDDVETGKDESDSKQNCELPGKDNQWLTRQGAHCEALQCKRSEDHFHPKK